MFGNIGQIAHLLRNAGQIKENMQRMQERLQQARFVAESGGGQVRATVDGKGELIAIALEPALISGGDKELIEDLIVAAMQAAVVQSREAMKKEFQAAAGGMDLGGMLDMIK